jgi:predicted transcriptional regulator
MEEINEKLIEQLGEIFQQQGFGRTEALTLASLVSGTGSQTGRQIEHDTGLRQPEVSKATTELYAKGYVAIKYQSHSGKGRPEKAVSLRDNVPDMLLKAETKRHEEMMEQIKKLEKLTSKK